MASQRRGDGRDDRTSRHGPSGGRHEPVGIERARRRDDAPPRRPQRRETAPPRPPLPEDEEPDLPRSVHREIERVLAKGDRARDVALALSIGSQAIDLGRPDVAVEVLSWAKHVAPRVPAVREAHGVARYLDEDFAGALTELQAYRRMTGRVDQNHLVADCLRALGRDIDRVGEAIEELLRDPRAPEERRAEGAVVWAAALADAGDVAAGRAVLRRFLEAAGTDRDASHDLRVRVLAAELAEREDDAAEAARHREVVAAVAPELLVDDGGDAEDGDERFNPPR